MFAHFLLPFFTTAARDLTKVISEANEILAQAQQVPVYDYGDGDVELVGRYKKSIFELLRDAKRIRTDADNTDIELDERERWLCRPVFPESCNVCFLLLQ